MTGVFKASLVNRYLAHKQHLLPASHLADVVQVTRDIVALHATSATSPYLSLWARVPDFQCTALKDALYQGLRPRRERCAHGLGQWAGGGRVGTAQGLW